MEQVILFIFSILLISFMLRIIFGFMKIPKLLAPIFVGLLFQLLFPIQLKESLDLINFLAEFGIIMLLFYIGLEVNIQKFTKKYRETVGVALIDFLTTFVISFSICLFFLKYEWITAFVIASVLSITAEGVAVLLLKENRLLKSKMGELVVGAGMIDDIIGIVILLFLSIFISYQTFSIMSILPFILGVLVIAILFYFINRISNIIDFVFIRDSFIKYPSELLTLSILFLLSFALFTQVINLEFTIGAIMAGLLLNFSLKNKSKKGVREEGEVKRIISNVTFGFLIYFFLFWIGIQFDISNVSQSIVLGIFFAALAFGGKFLGSLLSEHRYKESFKDSLLTGIGLSSKGGIDLVIIAIAKNAGLINEEIFSSLVIMSILLTFVVPIIFNFFVKKK